ncbi:MAG: DUF5331 domain-containing protein [Cyanobacteria bacterium]|nr:DUF5331 domain-containing protein [Cyanobacteria bacterium CG_2015-16_32_12]NCQ42096.1 DUF5331 domain-containing protein [Cyanobacteria bacterium CG_2015-04_32_10]NCS86089.1 DUF5331 domain-containing protein [Cyanobacteria bacterium CG_2015-02_32_10]
MEDFEEFKVNLREKWLDYCEVNEEYLHVWYGDYGVCPEANFILGVITGIEPKVIEWVNFYSSHVSPKSKINGAVAFLELNFDYKKALETRKEKKAKNQIIEPPSPLDDFRKQIKESSNIEN